MGFETSGFETRRCGDQRHVETKGLKTAELADTGAFGANRSPRRQPISPMCD
jgi:hypothetical protein